MQIAVIGPWVLLVLGVVTLLAAVWASVTKPNPTRLWLMWVFGLAIAGIGIYGPVFLGPYQQFIGAITAMQEKPNQDTYKEAFVKVGKGELPPRYQEVVLAYALDRPVPDMANALKGAISQATDPQGKVALEKTAQSLQEKKAVAEQITKNILNEGPSARTKLETLDPTTKSLVSEELRKQPDSTLRAVQLDRPTVDKLAQPRDLRVTKNAH
jgi:hypothetical protein